ncbi:tRNA dihydrouridine(16) synthase DusC [Comamonas testosteroni]|uniref:tRNA-dihydrouridine(16) synthase n=1 Tax=Comamonas testosteroni TaxID=285 RepID=A0A373FCH4_COMTE|nr:tRNA-dihydrouridine synthase [Comamonas testosteroni]RGE41810.1 tRNA dihydrouridine(16) synthase DusC [Comamonas testosteroni]
MRLLLAPMEGLLDFVLRDVLTRVGGADRCVSEFIRISGSLLPDKVYLRTMPELRNGSKTLAGVPVRAQLLGSDPVSLAENAASLARLGPEGIDLNFGCPAKVVNRHGGGASLLQDPAQIAKVVEAVRKAVPAQMPVSAKMRLGFNDRSLMTECAQAMEQGGACEIVVHARTKLDGYRPPAYWEEIPRIREAVSVPVVANGEIWTVEEALRCREVSGCSDLMLGRSIVADPGLALAIRRAVEGGAAAGAQDAAGIDWLQLVPQVQRFWEMVCEGLEPRQRAGRLKQWLNLMRRRFPEAEIAYQEVRTQTDQRAITAWVEALPQRDLGVEWAWPQVAATADCPAPEAQSAAA